MAMTCRTCRHESRDLIDAAVLRGLPYRRIATHFQLSEASVRRHGKKHVPEMLVKSKKVNQLLNLEAVFKDMSVLYTRMLRLSEACERVLEDPDDPERWKRFVHRAEALYALISYRAGNEGGVAGIQWAEKEYKSTPGELIDFASAADPESEIKYLQQAWGAYGAAYGSQLFTIGIFWEVEGHMLPVPSETFGDRLAKIFEDELGELATLFAQIVARGSVTKEEIDEKLKALTEVSHKLAEAMYKKEQGGAEQPGQADQKKKHELFDCPA